MPKRQMTIAEAIEFYLEKCITVKHLKDETVYKMRSDFNLLITASDGTNKKIISISNKDIEEWIKLQSEINPKTGKPHVGGRSINGRVRNFKAMVKWFHGMQIKTPNLCTSLIPKLPETPPRRACYSYKTVDDAMRRVDKRTWLMLQLCYSCGLRLSEMLSLKVENFDGRKIEFVGKCGIAGKVVISKEVYRRMNHWLLENRISTGYIFPGQSKGKHLSTCTARNHMKRAFKNIGINNFYPHALRHSFASDLLENGVQKETIQRMLRHVSLSNTERYAKELTDHTQENFDRYVHKKHHHKFTYYAKMVLINLLERATIRITRNLTK